MENKSSSAGEPLWRGKLSDAERAALRAQPELELEARLTAALAKIPAAPVASNFTARVLQAVEREETRAARRGIFRWNWHVLLPRCAVAAAILFFAGTGLLRHETHLQRAALARNFALAAGSQPLPSVEALKNFDAIRRMSQPRADDELLTLLQ